MTGPGFGKSRFIIKMLRRPMPGESLWAYVKRMVRHRAYTRWARQIVLTEHTPTDLIGYWP